MDNKVLKLFQMNCEKVFIVLKAAKICRKLEKELKGKEWNELKSKGRQIYEFSLTFNGGKKEIQKNKNTILVSWKSQRIYYAI